MSAAENPVADQLADFVNVMMIDVMDSFLAALTACENVDEIEDAVSAWRDLKINDDDRAIEMADLAADVVTDAVRQIGERQEKRSAVRITRPDGTRLTFSWRADEEDPSPTFNQAVLGAVKRALREAR